jgi:hypothetical protein
VPPRIGEVTGSFTVTRNSLKSWGATRKFRKACTGYEKISKRCCRPPADFLGTMNSSPNRVTAQYPSCYDSSICSAKLMRTSRSMSDQHELEELVKTAQAECDRLRKENVRLRAMLSIHDPVLEHPAPSAPGSAPTPVPCSSITEASTPEQKIALFRGLFRGREELRF